MYYQWHRDTVLAYTNVQPKNQSILMAIVKSTGIYLSSYLNYMQGTLGGDFCILLLPLSGHGRWFRRRSSSRKQPTQLLQQ